MIEKEECDRSNNKIIKAIEENYMKDFHKEIKKFQIIMTGYNASKYKSLQVFKKHDWGWSMFYPSFKEHGESWISCVFNRKISSKVGINLSLHKSLNTGILKYDQLLYFGNRSICIFVDQTDEIYNLIKQLEKDPTFGLIKHGNKSLEYIYSRNENGYKITVFPKN